MTNYNIKAQKIVKKQISIILVTYNSYPFFKQSIELIEQNLNGFQVEIVVVDNASKDNESNEYLNILDKKMPANNIEYTIIKLSKNTGISVAVNVGVAHSKYDTVICFNNDIYLDDNSNSTFIDMYNYLHDNNNIGVISPIFVKLDGSPDINYNLEFNIINTITDRIRKIFSNKSKYESHEKLLSLNKDYINVDSLSGQFFMMKKGIYTMVGGFDINYFLYSLDWDMSEKIKQHGLYNTVYTKGILVHGVGSSTARARYLSTFDLYKSFAQFLIKWKIKPFIIKTINVVLFSLPTILEILLRNLKNNKNVSD